MKKKKLLVKVGVSFFALTLFATICLMGFTDESDAKTLKIGAVWGLTGPGSEIQIIMSQGEELCRDWINAKGGVTVKGEKYQIELITEDVKGTPDGAVTSANKLVHQDKVKFVTGLTVPFLAEAVASVTEPNKIAYWASTFDTMTPKNAYSVSAYTTYVSYKPLLYDYLQKTYPNLKKVAMTEILDPIVQRVAAVGREEIKKRGLTYVGNVQYPFGSQDYYNVLNKVLTYKPEILDINLEWPGGAGALAKQARELGFNGPIMGNSPWDPIFVRDKIGSKEYATDMFFPSFEAASAGADIPPMAKTIIKQWTDKHKTPCIIEVFRGWDPLYTLVQAIEAAQSLDPTDVIKTFEKMKTVDTSQGVSKIGGLKTYGYNHMTLQPCPLTRLNKGQIEFLGWNEIVVP